MVRMEFVVDLAYLGERSKVNRCRKGAEVAKKKAVGYFEILGCISVTCTGKG
jgi:hypothetical protein